jgi:hypothetical protein
LAHSEQLRVVILAKAVAPLVSDRIGDFGGAAPRFIASAAVGGVFAMG